MAHRHYRSAFESMVFHSTGRGVPGVIITDVDATVSSNVYEWVANLHPSLQTELDNAPVPVMFRRKLQCEHLFEVVTMYLFSGLTKRGSTSPALPVVVSTTSPPGGTAGGSTSAHGPICRDPDGESSGSESSGPDSPRPTCRDSDRGSSGFNSTGPDVSRETAADEEEHNTPIFTRQPSSTDGVDTDNTGTDLLHYLMYIVPEADKLHVVDLDAHREHFDRLNKVRVLFDSDDYRFRVVVKRQDRDKHLYGWIDVALELRQLFDSEVENLKPAAGCIELSDHWVEIVRAFRQPLVGVIARHTGVDIKTVDNWVLSLDNIVWEETMYGAGDMTHRHLLDDIKRPARPDQKPFLVSYWADNYLTFANYKMARMLNGLVGYGEFLYKDDNNYSKKDPNNFFVGGPETKRWLWDDLPIGDDVEADQPHTVHSSASDRYDTFEAIIENKQLYITNGFRNMVRRRHAITLQDVLHTTILQVKECIPTIPIKAEEELEYFAHDQFDVLFNGSTGARHGGMLNETVRGDCINAFLEKVRSGIGVELDETSDKWVKLVATVRYMFMVMIHVSREQWLLRDHTEVLDTNQLKRLTDVYKEGFWKTVCVEPDGAGAKARIKKNLNIPVTNNSSLDTLYQDKAVHPYEVGYVDAFKKNAYPCNPYVCGLSEITLHEYYDRKGPLDNVESFISSCDLTSLLRNTQALLQGFDGFITTLSSACSVSTRHRVRQQPLIQTARSLFASHGVYYVLAGHNCIRSPVYTHGGGKRPIHVDDVLVFARILTTLVANPGAFNLLNSPNNQVPGGSGCWRNTPPELSRPGGPIRAPGSGTSRPYKAGVANSGFVTMGYTVIDGDGTDAYNTSWIGIAEMMFTKLRVGMVDQPGTCNTARVYLNEVLNNTRRTSSCTALQAVDGFITRTYALDGFIESVHFENFEDMPSSASIEKEKAFLKELQREAGCVVDALLASCRDANRSVDFVHDVNYAFPQLKKLGIVLPEKKHKQLFYIVFGETIACLMDDLYKQSPTSDKHAQHVQQQTNKMFASVCTQQLKPFLESITDWFFHGVLHRNLIRQVCRQDRPKTPTDVKRATRPCFDPQRNKIFNNIPHARFNAIYDNLHDALLHLRNHVGTTIPVEWKQCSAVGAKNNIDSIQIEQLGSAPSQNDPEHENQARMIFWPYVDIHDRLDEYRKRPSQTTVLVSKWGLKPLRHDVKHCYKNDFEENRMLLMCICEEQLHLIQTHSQQYGVLRGCKSWELLFNIFIFHRQTFAEMKL
jgi:hypothetical protein